MYAYYYRRFSGYTVHLFVIYLICAFAILGAIYSTTSKIHVKLIHAGISGKGLKMANLDSMERIWFDRRKFEEAERKFAEHVAREHASLVVQVTIVHSQQVKFVLLISGSWCAA